MAISYNKLWKLLVDKKMSKADLRKAAGIAPNTMTRLRRDEEVTLSVLNRICVALDVNIGDVMESRSFTNAMEKVRAYVKRAMEAMEMAGQSSGERWARLALEYLKKNYGNPSLSLNDVCEHLNISTSRFSSVFKEATGKTFTEALNGIRMDWAKQLLRETSLKNYEIAEKVGFSDPHYFSIAFKKSTGLTPKEYSREK
mgnify:CR=1 FL=1